MLSVLGRFLISRRLTGSVCRAVGTMAEALAKIPDVEIDPEGTFKYILLRVKVKDSDAQKDVVRGTKSAEYHSKFISCRFAARGASSVSVLLEVLCLCPSNQTVRQKFSCTDFSMFSRMNSAGHGFRSFTIKIISFYVLVI